MDREAVLAAFDQQIRQQPWLDASGGRVEYARGVIRMMAGGEGWSGVSWSALDEGGADEVIAAQVTRFTDLCCPWEWKYYSYDRPRNLPERLLAAGFTRQPAEAVLVAEIEDLDAGRPTSPDGSAAGGPRSAGCRGAGARA